MSETFDFDQLLNEKTCVVNESRELDEEQKQLKLRAKTLTEKIIQELRIKNNSKRANVYLLQSTVKDLESQLNALTFSTILEDTSENVESNEETAETVITSSKKTQETVEETVTLPETPRETIEATITSPEELGIVSATEVTEEIDTPSKRKTKRKFF